MSANGESRNLLSKIKFTTKFSNLSLAQNTEKDGNTEDDTLIHNAFVKYFETKQEPFPEWLGEKRSAQPPPRNAYQPSNTNNYSQYQPVYNSRNSGGAYQQQQQQQQQQPQQQQQFQSEQSPPLGSNSTYTPRSSSRLQDMYNKSRQQSVPGAGYSSQQVQGQPTLGRANTGGRLREKMLYNQQTPSPTNSRPNSGPPSSGGYSAGTGSSKATWGSRG